MIASCVNAISASGRIIRGVYKFLKKGICHDDYDDQVHAKTVEGNQSFSRENSQNESSEEERNNPIQNEHAERSGVMVGVQLDVDRVLAEQESEENEVDEISIPTILLSVLCMGCVAVGLYILYAVAEVGVCTWNGDAAQELEEGSRNDDHPPFFVQFVRCIQISQDTFVEGLMMPPVGGCTANLSIGY